MVKKKSVNWTTAILIAVVIIIIFQYQPLPRESFVEERVNFRQYIGEPSQLRATKCSNLSSWERCWSDSVVFSNDVTIASYTLKTQMAGSGCDISCMRDPQGMTGVSNPGTKSYIDSNGCQHWSGVDRTVYTDCNGEGYDEEVCFFKRGGILWPVVEGQIISETCEDYNSRWSSSTPFSYEYARLENTNPDYYSTEKGNGNFEILDCTALYSPNNNYHSRHANIVIKNEDYGGLGVLNCYGGCWYNVDVYLNNILDHSTGWTTDEHNKETLIDPVTGLNILSNYNAERKFLGRQYCGYMLHTYVAKFDEHSFGFDIDIPDEQIMQSNTQTVNIEVNNRNIGSVYAKLITTYKVPITSFGDDEFFIKTIEEDRALLPPSFTTYSYQIPAEQVIDKIIAEPLVQLYIPKSDLSGLNGYYCTHDTILPGGRNTGPLSCAPEYVLLGSIVDEPHTVSILRMPDFCAEQGITTFMGCKNHLVEYYADLNLGIDKLENIIEQLTQTQTEKLELIAKLKLTVEEQKQLIKDFELTIEDQTENIRLLDLTVKEQAGLILAFELTIKEQADYIIELDLSVKEQAELINEMTNNLATKAALVNQLTAENSVQAELIAAMKLSFSNQGIILSQLENTVADDAEIILDLTSNVEEQAVILNNMKLTNAEQANLIAEMYGTIDDQIVIIKEMKLTNADQAEILNRLAGSNEELNDYLDELKLVFDEQKQLLEELEKLPDPSLSTVTKYVTSTTTTETGSSVLYLLIFFGAIGFVILMTYKKKGFK